MKILYLYAELSPYLRPVFESYVVNYSSLLHVVYWDSKKKTPYLPVPMNNVFYYKRSAFNFDSMNRLAEKIEPDIIYIVGWMDFDYMRVARIWRRRGVPVVVGFDDVWKGNLRQRIGSIIFRLFGNLIYSHAFVSFNRQYEFAKQLGFKDDSILFNLLSCDRTKFDQAKLSLDTKLKNYPRIFLYVGRFSQEKGLDVLVEAFKIYRERYNGVWSLMCVGNGPLDHLLKNIENLEVKNFVDPEELALVYQQSGSLIMASYSDVSPLAVHEAATSCLPLILSNGVGNKSTFLIDGYNGFTIKSGSAHDLAQAMHKISILSNLELIEMGKRSWVLSMRVTPEHSAASLMSIFK